jgi:hypothetical protein
MLTRNLSDPLIDGNSTHDQHADQEICPLRIGAKQAQAQ